MKSKTIFMRAGLLIVGILNVITFAGCGGGTASTLNNQPPPVVPQPAVVTLAPVSVTLQPGGVQQFIATVSPSGAKQAVTWTLSGAGCSAATCGTLDQTGKYTAPAAVPNPLIVTLVATSALDGSKSAFALITLTGKTSANNAKLSGQYAFLFRGSNSAGPMSIVGSFTADGNGSLTAGNADIATVGGVRTNQGLAPSTYSIGSDNSGSMTLNTAVNFPTGNFAFAFSFALDSFSTSGVATAGRLVESDGTNQAGAGFFVRQDPAVFSASALDGGYAFGFAGPEGIDENVALGRFTASGGLLVAGHLDLVGFGTGSGLQPDQAFTGTYSVDAAGRGEAMLNIPSQPNVSNFVLYVVSSNQSLWMDTGGSYATGAVLQQSGGPFTASSLNGPAVFSASGFTVAGNDVTVGVVQFDGNGGLNGTNDENYFGLSFTDEPITGTYTVDSNGFGRGVITSNTGPGLSNFYLVSPGRGFIISGNDSLELGTFEPQTGNPFSSASLSGNYAIGTLPLLSKLGPNDVAGVLVANGADNLSGTLVTKAGTQAFTATSSVAPNGRTTLSITPISGSPSSLVLYLISPAKAVGVQTMNFGPANAVVNVIEK